MCQICVTFHAFACVIKFTQACATCVFVRGASSNVVHVETFGVSDSHNVRVALHQEGVTRLSVAVGTAHVGRPRNVQMDHLVCQPVRSGSVSPSSTDAHTDWIVHAVEGSDEAVLEVLIRERVKDRVDHAVDVTKDREHVIRINLPDRKRAL